MFGSFASFESGVEEMFVMAESLPSSNLTTVCRNIGTIELFMAFVVVTGQKNSTLRPVICLWQWFDLNAMGVWKHLKCKVKPCFSAADKKTTYSSSGDIMAFYFVSKIAIDGHIVQAEILMFVNCQILEGIHLVADNSANVQNALTG